VIPPLLPQYLGVAGGAKTLAVSTSTMAVKVVSDAYGTPSNGITKLYAQELAAKLAISSGANPSTVSAVLSAADAFLTLHDYTSWSSLTSTQQTTVNNWATALNNYNSGSTGPGECK
jgi:hypothetical protein